MRDWAQIIAFGVLAAFVPLLVRDSYLLQVATLILLYAYLGSAWNLLGGFAGQLSLGHAVFFGLGAYLGTVLQLDRGMNPWMGLLVAGLAGAGLSWLIGYPCFRLRGPYYTLTTIAFAELTRLGVMNTNTVFGWHVNGARGLLIPSLGEAPLRFQSLHKAYYYAVILCLLLLLQCVGAWLRERRMGHYWIAVREDEEAAASLGVNVKRAKLSAAALSGAFTAMGGVFYAQLVLFVDPTRVLGMDLSVECAVVALVGGAGTLWGPVLGALLLRPLTEWLQWTSGSRFRGLHLLLYGAMLIVVVTKFPNGLAGSWRWLHRKEKDPVAEAAS